MPRTSTYGIELSEQERAADCAWTQAIDTGGEDRQGAWVAELTDHLELSAWPEGSRLIVGRERPHRGAQFTIFDEHGYRHTCLLTDQASQDITALELRHCGRARVENSIRRKDTGMRNLPRHAFEHNQTWLETSGMLAASAVVAQATRSDRADRRLGSNRRDGDGGWVPRV